MARTVTLRTRSLSRKRRKFVLVWIILALRGLDNPSRLFQRGWRGGRFLLTSQTPPLWPAPPDSPESWRCTGSCLVLVASRYPLRDSPSVDGPTIASAFQAPLHSRTTADPALTADLELNTTGNDDNFAKNVEAPRSGSWLPAADTVMRSTLPGANLLRSACRAAGDETIFSSFQSEPRWEICRAVGRVRATTYSHQGQMPELHFSAARFIYRNQGFYRNGATPKPPTPTSPSLSACSPRPSS